MVDLASQPTPVQSVYVWHAEDKLYVNRRYQRKLVWTLKEKQKLIESILKKYPIPAILIVEMDKDPHRYEIIDGLQRLNTIISFIEGSFSTENGKYFNVSAFPTARSRMEAGNFSAISQEELISPQEVSTLLDYILALSVMRQASENEIDDVFERVNSYGHRLSDQERRQAGIRNQFSDMVRELACTLRGDESNFSLPLSKMPEISIDLPKTNHGYKVQADEVFWVEQGILRATDLRDSMDEQCIADITASIVMNFLIERSKDALDDLYGGNKEKSDELLAALNVYGKEKFENEFKYCIEQISNVCHAGGYQKLRNIIFEQKNTNAFPSVFSVIFIAFHELFFREHKKIADLEAVKNSITDLTRRIDTSRRATVPEERRKNVDTIKSLISRHFIEGNLTEQVYGNHTHADIEASIRRSGIELNDYELKQGIVSLADERKVDDSVIRKIIHTICAISNNGPNRMGKIIIGVADKKRDVDRIEVLDKIRPRRVGDRWVVGIDREAKALGLTTEQYHSIIRKAISDSELSDHLKVSVLSHIDYNSYYGLGMIVITIPQQQDPSFVGEKMFWREGDRTIEANGRNISIVSRRF